MGSFVACKGSLCSVHKLPRQAVACWLFPQNPSLRTQGVVALVRMAASVAETRSASSCCKHQMQAQSYLVAEVPARVPPQYLFPCRIAVYVILVVTEVYRMTIHVKSCTMSPIESITLLSMLWVPKSFMLLELQTHMTAVGHT